MTEYKDHYLNNTFLPSLYEHKKDNRNFLSDKQFNILKSRFTCICKNNTIEIYTYTHRNYTLRLYKRNNKRWLEWKSTL